MKRDASTFLYSLSITLGAAAVFGFAVQFFPEPWAYGVAFAGPFNAGPPRPEGAPVMKRAALLRRTELRSKRRKSDVPDWLFGYLLGRDRECKAPALGATDPCFGRLTIEHVKFESMTGKRAPSDKFHTLILCLGHNTGWALLSTSKDAEREYLLRIEGASDAA